MPDSRRKYADGGPYFLTIGIEDWRSDFLASRQVGGRRMLARGEEELAG